MGAVYAVSRDQCEEWVQCMQYHGTNARNPRIGPVILHTLAALSEMKKINLDKNSL
jgi:hypothetical protein